MGPLIVEQRGCYGVRVVDADRVFVRLGYGSRWEAYRVEDGLELFTGYLCEESAARIEAAVGMRSGPMFEVWPGRYSYGWRSSSHQALGSLLQVVPPI